MHFFVYFHSVYKPQPLDMVPRIVGEMGEMFMNACTRDAENISSVDENFQDFAYQRRDMSEMLFYRILERIVRAEREKASCDELGVSFFKTISYSTFYPGFSICGHFFVINAGCWYSIWILSQPVLMSGNLS